MTLEKLVLLLLVVHIRLTFICIVHALISSTFFNRVHRNVQMKPIYSCSLCSVFFLLSALFVIFLRRVLFSHAQNTVVKASNDLICFKKRKFQMKRMYSLMACFRVYKRLLCIVNRIDCQQSQAYTRPFTAKSDIKRLAVD